MKSKIFLLIGLILLISALPLYSNTVSEKEFEEVEIYKIEFFGNKIIKDDRLKNLISTKIGDTYKSNIIKEDIKKLYKTNYFYKIDIVTKLIKDKVLLIYRFEENPILADLRISGNDKISESEILEVIPIEKGKLTSRDILETTKAIIEQFYLLKGFNNVQISEKITPIGQGSIQYSVKIKEGKRGYVKGIVIKGTSDENIAEILKKLETKTKWVFSPITGRGRLSEDIIDADRSKVRGFFLNNGYINAKVSKPRIEYVKEKDGYLVVFDVEEGDRYKVGSITFSGDLLDNKDLSEYTSLDDVEYFSLEKMNTDIESLTIAYGDEAYAFANINPIFNQDDEQLKISIKYNVEKGEKYKVNKITISGNTRTRDKVIRREIKIKEQENYSGTKIKKSKSYSFRKNSLCR